MPVVVDIQAISNTISNLIDFVQTNEKIKPDFEEYLKTINGINLEGSKLQAACIPYITQRMIFDENKMVIDIYLEENIDISDVEKEIVIGLKNSISSVFQVKKVLRNGFYLYNLVNEKDYTVMPLVKMSNLKDVLPDRYALIRIFKFQNDYYMLEISDLIPPYQKEEVLNFAVAKIIEKPEDLYIDNDKKFEEVKAYVEKSISTFQDLFKTDEIVTTNRKIDGLVDLVNEYQQTGNMNGSISDFIEQKETLEYFKVEEFSNSYDTYFQKSMEGFSSHIEKYDVGYLYDKELGVYIIPFWATLCKIFTSDDYKLIKGYKDCVVEFIKNDKIPPSFIYKLMKKMNSKEDFEKRVSEILDEKLNIEEIVKKYKNEYQNKTIFSSASALYCSKTFLELMNLQNKD